MSLSLFADSRKWSPSCYCGRSMTHRKLTISRLTMLFGVVATALAGPHVAFAGASFGIFDARTLAMGGVSVAAANNDNAQFYNSALLAFNEEIEEKTRDSRFLFPIILPQVGESAIEVERVSSNDAAQNISRAIAAYNTAPSALTAQPVADAAAGLDTSLAALDGEDLFADVFFGMAISEPGKFQGAGFFMGTRLMVGGGSTITDADRDLLGNYREALTFVATNGAQGIARPELFDAGGALIDPGNNFDSTATAAGVLITEAGVAMSTQLQVFGQPIAGGFSFKVQSIDTFEDTERVTDDRIDTGQNSEHRGKVNIDFGFVRQFGDRWRVGLAVKDAIPNNYETSRGTLIRLRPRARIGVAYEIDRLQVSVDADLTKAEPFGVESATQELAIGAEWRLANLLRVRAGYRHHIAGNRDGIASVGIGSIWKRLAFDAAYAEGDDSRALALQLGIVF